MSPGGPRYVKGTEKPTFQYLNWYVIPGLALHWYNLGTELLTDISILNTIEKEHLDDKMTCCREMFQFWLQIDNEASWTKLLNALHKIGQAQNISPRLIIGNEDLDPMRLEILQSMSKAREHGCSLKVRYGKVLICGAGAAGKTNFLNLLMEEDFQPIHVSTEVAKTQQVTVAMKAHVSKNDYNKKAVFKKMDIDSEIDQLMLHLPKKYTMSSIHKDSRSAYTEEHVQLQGDTKFDIQKQITIVEDMMSNKLADLQEKTLPIQSTEKVWDVLTFMDTGGQPQFISMLPAVNNFAMITFIVHKMTGGKESLTKKVKVEHRDKKGQDIIVPHTYEYTYHQLIETLMSYASSVLAPDKEFLTPLKDCTSRVDKDKTTSSISFIGTHSNNVPEDNIEEIDNELVETIEYSDIRNIKPSLNTNYEYLVPIDNEKQEKDKIQTSINSKKFTDPSSIRIYIHEWLEKQDVYSVPIQWLLLELEIRKVCFNRNCSFIKYDEVLRISRHKQLGEDDFIKSGLRFHHLFGVLLFFEEVEGMCKLIITDHQWLFNRLTDIVLYSFKDRYDTRLDRINIERKGIFKETLLDELNISKDFEKSGIDTKMIDPKKSLLNLLQHLRIIASLNEDATQYFMPSLLSSCDLTNLQQRIPGTSKFIFETNEIYSEPFLIQFKSLDNTDSFPRGIFCFLVVQLIHSTEWKLYRQAHGNLLSFIIKDTACFITLIDRIFCLEVQVTHDEIGSNSVHDGIFITVRDAIVDAFAKVGNRLNINIKLKYGFWCKKCEKLKERHISLLEGHEFCYCINDEPTKLQRSHIVWFKTFKNSSIKQDDYLEDCPEMKQLQDVMRIENIKITASWYELGLELLVSDNDLEVIKVNNPLNVTACCCEMFDKWLKRTPDASWKQLV